MSGWFAIRFFVRICLHTSYVILYLPCTDMLIFINIRSKALAGVSSYRWRIIFYVCKCSQAGNPGLTVMFSYAIIMNGLVYIL